MCPSRSIKLSVRKGVTTRHEYKLFKLHGKRCIRTGGSFLFPSTWLKDSPLQPTCLQFLWKRAQIALEMFDYAFRKQQLPTLGLRIHGSLGISSTMSPGMWFFISSWQNLHFNSFKLFFFTNFHSCMISLPTTQRIQTAMASRTRNKDLIRCTLHCRSNLSMFY